MKKFRKAAGAGVVAAAGIAGTQIVKDGLPATRDGWLGFAAALAGGFLVAAVAVYNIPYTPA